MFCPLGRGFVLSVVKSVAEPSAKTGYTVLAGAVVTIVYSIVTATTGFVPDPELVGASVVLATALIGLLVPAKSGKYVNLGVIDGEDPDDALTGEVADDPEPEEVVDPEDPSFVEVVR